jgi:hypothetical protein
MDILFQVIYYAWNKSVDTVFGVYTYMTDMTLKSRKRKRAKNKDVTHLPCMEGICRSMHYGPRLLAGMSVSSWLSSPVALILQSL